MKREHFLFGAFVIAMALLGLYGSTLGHPFLFDEQAIILNSPFARFEPLSLTDLFSTDFFNFKKTFSGPASPLLYYRPLTALSFALNFRFAQGNPLPYNLTNLLIHLAVVLLLYAILRRFFRAPFVAFAAALLYAIHPVQTEAVTYLASRGDLLYALFLLMTLLLYWKGRFFAAILTTVCAFFTKETGLLVPLYLWVFELTYLKKERPVRALFRLSPFFFAAVAFILFRIIVLRFPLGSGHLLDTGSCLRFLSMGDPILGYLRALASPEPFSFCLPVAFAEHFWDVRVLQTFLVFGLVTALAFVFSRNRGPAFFALAVCVIGILPTLQLVRFSPAWAEHYLYVPGIGLSILFAGVVDVCFRRKKTTALFLVLYAVFVLFLSLRTAERNVVYADPALFYEKLSGSNSPYAAYGDQNLTREVFPYDARKALAHARRAVALAPTPESYNNLGVCFWALGEKQRAIRAFKTGYLRTGSAARQRDAEYLLPLAAFFEATGSEKTANKLYEKILFKVPGQRTALRSILSYEERRWGFARAWTYSGSLVDAPNCGEGTKAFLILWRLRCAYRNNRFGWALQEAWRLNRLTHGRGWFGDVSNVVCGKTRPEILFQKYPLLSGESEEYALIGWTLRGDRQALAAYLKTNRERLDLKAAQSILFRRELLIATQVSDEPSGTIS